jgi:hypothetical protein
MTTAIVSLSGNTNIPFTITPAEEWAIGFGLFTNPWDFPKNARILPPGYPMAYLTHPDLNSSQVDSKSSNIVGKEGV